MPEPRPKKETSGLSRFQDRLLELLAAGKAPADVRAALLSDPAMAEFNDYINAMDDRMIAVAAELVGKWSTTGEPS